MTKSKTKDNTCPHCLSKLFDEAGVVVCSGSKLKIWEDDFKRYKKMSDKEKQAYLISFSDSERFLDLYNKWDFVDSNGQRPNFTCEYTNKIFNAVPDTRVLLPDPMQINSLEKRLRRRLTQEELTGQKDIVIAGKVVELEMMVFPDDF